MKTHLVIPDGHARPDFHNERFDLLGDLIVDVKPDVIINIGDHWDMPSLSSYDKGKPSSFGLSYTSDIHSGQEAMDRTFHRMRKQKKSKPLTIFLGGNHEHRLQKAMDTEYTLRGTLGISMDHYQVKDWYDECYWYTGATPGQREVDGILYAHYLPSGPMGRPISGIHQAKSLLAKYHTSCTVGHSHILDFGVFPTTTDRKIMGLSCGCFTDFDKPWAGHINRQFWQGVVVKRGVEDGQYSPEFISMKMLQEEYGKRKY